MNTNKSIGELIKRARNVAGLTQTDLGDKVHLGLKQIQNIEKGETAITIERLEEISSILNVPFTYFLSNTKSIVGDGEDGVSLDVMTNDNDSDRFSTQHIRNGIICEYVRNEETLRLIFPSNTSTEDMKEKVEVLVKGIFGSRIQQAKDN